MSNEDFDISGLADYLHLSPDQVTKMASRGKLPGRRIGGSWRFSRPEIHHWLEERIGLSDDEELAKVANLLKRKRRTEEARLTDLLIPSAIAIPLAARTRSSVISSMVELAAGGGLLWDPAKMTEAVRARENLHPTALDNGVALLHPRRPLSNILAEPLLALGRTDQAIPFGGAGGCLTDIFFLICSVDDGGHLSVLARLSRLVGDSEFLSGLREASNASQVHQLIGEFADQFEDS